MTRIAFTRAHFVVVPHFMKTSIDVALSARLCVTGSRRSCQEVKLTSNSQVAKYLLKKYETDNIIAEADTDIINYKQPQDLNIIYFLPSLWTTFLI